MVRLLVTAAGLLLAAAVTSAADPTIQFAEGSPKGTSFRVSAAGKYSIPANAGNVTWSYKEIKVEIRLKTLANNGTWDSKDATVDQAAKTWSYIDLTPRAAGNYEVRARLVATQVTMYPPPTPPTSKEVVAEQTKIAQVKP